MTFSLKHIFYWTFVVAVALFFLRVPILAMIEYGFFESFYVIWGKMLGFDVNFVIPFDKLHPDMGWVFIGRIVGSVGCLFITAFFGIAIMAKLSSLYDYINRKEESILAEALYQVYLEFDETMENWSFDDEKRTELTKFVADIQRGWEALKGKVCKE